MRNVDLSPLYRSFIGFDHLAQMMDNASRNAKPSSFPPYNIELLGEDKYQITMAVAGFEEHELHIETEKNALLVKGVKESKSQDGERSFIHQGIAERNFEHKFQLGDHVKVRGASLNNGLLNIALEREIPEADKPRTIKINGQQAEMLRSA